MPPPLSALLQETRKSAEIIEDRLYFVPFSRPPSCVSLPPSHSLLCTDELLTYHPFYEDFGPFHLGCTVRFCAAVDDLLALSPTQRVVVHCNSTREAKSNAAVLLGCYAVWKLRRSADEAYAPLRQFEPYSSFRDASIGPHTYKLSPLDCISAFASGLRVGLFDPLAFSVDEYEHFEQVEHGDLNVVVPGRFIAFASPSPASASAHPAGYVPYTPNMYLPIFRHFHVTAVVRLNQSAYSPAPFISHGIRHAEMVFPDGSNPPQAVVHRFLQLCDEEESSGGGVIAVHCKAGLGRTGSLLGCWLMREYSMKASEAIAWLRLCRPGSVIGPQQEWLQSMEEAMWKEGRARRARRRSLSHKPTSPSPAPCKEEQQEGEDDMAHDAKVEEAQHGQPLVGVGGLSLGLDHQANGLLAMKALRVGRGKEGKEGGKVGDRGTAAVPVHPMTTRVKSGAVVVVGDKRRASATSSVSAAAVASAVLRGTRSASTSPSMSPRTIPRALKKGEGARSGGVLPIVKGKSNLHGELSSRWIGGA